MALKYIAAFVAFCSLSAQAAETPTAVIASDVPECGTDDASNAPRKSFCLKKSEQITTIEIGGVSKLCGDLDGCEVRLGQFRYEPNDIVWSRRGLLFYNQSNHYWKASQDTTSGTRDQTGMDKAQNSQIVMTTADCQLVDGDKVTGGKLEDASSGFGLYRAKTGTGVCWLTLID